MFCETFTLSFKFFLCSFPLVCTICCHVSTFEKRERQTGEQRWHKVISFTAIYHWMERFVVSTQTVFATDGGVGDVKRKREERMRMRKKSRLNESPELCIKWVFYYTKTLAVRMKVQLKCRKVFAFLSSFTFHERRMLSCERNKLKRLKKFFFLRQLAWWSDNSCKK